MVFGILSDIHDRLENLEQALQLLQSKGVAELIFCGDFSAPFAANKLAESNLPVHAILGNNDGDRFLILEKTKAFPNFRIYGEYIGDTDNLLVIDGTRIAVTHYQADKQKFGNCLLLNPGEVAGIFGQPSVAIYDTTLKSSEILYF